jgi:hypothetical protein
VRGSNGIVAWTRSPVDLHTWSWICGRDNLAVAGASDAVTPESVAVAIAQHSATLVGSILQIAELDL